MLKSYDIHVLKDENHLAMKASEVIPVFLKDETLIAGLGLIGGLHQDVMSSLSHSHPLPLLSLLFLSDERSSDHKVVCVLLVFFFKVFMSVWSF